MPNTQDLYKNLQRKVATGTPVDIRDIAVKIDNEDQAIVDYMIANDPAQINALLHISDAPFFVGQNASFIPDANRMAAELKQLMVRKDHSIINDIIKAFRVNMGTANITTNPDLLTQMKLINLIGVDGEGKHYFKIKIG